MDELGYAMTRLAKVDVSQTSDHDLHTAAFGVCEYNNPCLNSSHRVCSFLLNQGGLLDRPTTKI
jgi:hypothetical protein